MRDFLIGIGAAAVVALFSVISLGFATFAAFIYLRALEGRMGAALIVCAAYGLLALTIWAIWAARRHGGRSRRAAAAPGTLDPLLQSLAAAGTKEDQLALVTAMKLGRQLSPMQLLAVALIGGFIAGRKLGK